MGFPASQKGLTRAIAALAFPAIVTNITVPLLGLCDIAIAGHKGGAAFIASLAVATQMFNMAYWLFGFLRMGSSGLTAQAFGAGDSRRTAVVALRAISIAVVAGALIIALQRPLSSLILAAMDVDPATAAMARRYFDIVVWGAPAVLSTYALTGWFIGMQDTRVPMAVSIAADVVNIGLSVALVFGLGWSIEGVATGTLVAQWVSFAAALTVCVRRLPALRPLWADIFRGDGIRLFFRVNADIFLRTLCLIAVTLWFTRSGARQGAVMLAVNALLMQLFTLFSYFMDGFAFSAEALVGRAVGAADRHSLRRTVAAEFRIGAVVAAIFTALYYFLGNEFLAVLTDDAGVISAAGPYLPWAVAIPFAGFAAFVGDGIVIGATMTRSLLRAMAGAMIAFFAVYLLAIGPLGNNGLWLAFLTYLATRGLVLASDIRRRLLRPVA